MEDSLEHTKFTWAKSPEKYVGMLSGVPHDFEEHVPQKDFERAYPGSKCSRIMKQDKPTYTVKVVFPDQSSLSKSLEDGVILDTYNAIWVVKEPCSSINGPTTA